MKSNRHSYQQVAVLFSAYCTGYNPEMHFEAVSFFSSAWAFMWDIVLATVLGKHFKYM